MKNERCTACKGLLRCTAPKGLLRYTASKGLLGQNVYFVRAECK